jgi:hypothetical protein
MGDIADGATKGLGIFSTLESATETALFLLATTFVLLVDTTLVQFNQAGIIDLIRNPELIKPSLGLQTILILVGFSFLTSLVLPLLAIFADEIIFHTVGRAWIKVDSFLNRKCELEQSLSQRKYDCVSPWELRRGAHEKKESYLLDLYNEYENRRRKNRKLMLKHSLYAFYALSMVFCNFFLVGGNDRKTILQETTLFLGSTTYIWCITMPLLFLIYFRIFRINDDPIWIYCPSLYSELKVRDKAKK